MDLLPLDSIVINTEAHIFPRFQLIRGLKTGWERKPRDKDGRIIKVEEKKPVEGEKKKQVEEDGKTTVKEEVETKEKKKADEAASKETI